MANVIQQKIDKIVAEQNLVLLERGLAIHYAWVALVANLNYVMFGKPGVGKTMLANNMFQRIEGARTFKILLSPVTPPNKVFGGIDVKALREEGESRTRITGYLPWADVAMVDEIFNGNDALQQDMLTILNEREYDNGGQRIKCPLRSVFAGTNKDSGGNPELQAFVDRLHVKTTVEHLRQRDNILKMVVQATDRMLQLGRGSATQTGLQTTITLAELDQANKQSLALDSDPAALELFVDMIEELRGQGIEISERQINEGMYGVLANAWLRGHDLVQTVDLDVLAAIWWNSLEEEETSRNLILGATNPGEKAAIDLLDALGKIKADYKSITEDKERDAKVKHSAALKALGDAAKVLNEGKQNLEKANAAGQTSARLGDVIARANALVAEVAQTSLGIDPNLALGML